MNIGDVVIWKYPLNKIEENDTMIIESMFANFAVVKHTSDNKNSIEKIYDLKIK